MTPQHAERHFAVPYGRGLRKSALIVSALTVPFLIASTVIVLDSRWIDIASFPFGFIPWAMTILVSWMNLRYFSKHGRQPSARFFILDVFAGGSYLAVLLAIWIFDIGMVIHGSANVLVAGYTTSLMMYNMLVHVFFALLVIQYWFSADSSGHGVECPNCHISFVCGSRQKDVPRRTQGDYDLLRGEEYNEDAVAYLDARPSDDMIRPSEDSAESSKPAMVEV